jgi:hypothetical protein
MFSWLEVMEYLIYIELLSVLAWRLHQHVIKNGWSEWVYFMDVIQRSLLTRILQITLKDKIINCKIYESTHTTPWSESTKRRRLSLFGHLLRLPEESPAKQALQEFTRTVKRQRGKPKTTWLCVVQTDSESADIYINKILDLNHVTDLANDRVCWIVTCWRAI